MWQDSLRLANLWLSFWRTNLRKVWQHCLYDKWAIGAIKCSKPKCGKTKHMPTKLWLPNFGLANGGWEPNSPKISIKKNGAHLKCPNPNKHELELNSNIWKYCSVKNFSWKKSWVIFGDCFHTHKKVRWMSFERDTVTHSLIDRAAAVHALAQDSVSWMW